MAADDGMLFRSKADTLALLRRFPDLNVPEMLAITVAEWQTGGDAVLWRVIAAFSGAHERLAVRSSARDEDTREASAAGVFQSVLNVPSADRAAIAAAIGEVVASYTTPNPDNQILIQPMVGNIVVSGVIMTHNMDDGSPYYVINYDDESGRTDTVTGGTGAQKTVYVYRGASETDFDSIRVRSFVSLAQRLEEICQASALDIEFGLDRSDALHVFQVRPIAREDSWARDMHARVSERIRSVENLVRTHMHPVQGLFGPRTIFGVMPDWNPAEMIGITPRRLASSLYRELITNRVWSQARELMGYRRKPRHELMLMIADRPYIDVRLSFNSFLPEGIDPATGEALVSAWLDRLDAHPEFHDKVEFEVASTAFDFCFDQDIAARYPGVLTPEQLGAYRTQMVALTAACMDPSPQGSLRSALGAIHGLETRQDDGGRHTGTDDDPLKRVRASADECRQLGTLSFSMLARHAFIAEALLRSACRRGALSAARLGQFKASIETVSRKLSHEFLLVTAGKLDRQDFLKRYGHLRPSTYDILSQRYADRDSLFSVDAASIPSIDTAAFEPDAAETAALDRLLQEAGFGRMTAAGIFDYARMAIAAREYAKFVFSRNVSEIVELIAAWGAQQDMDRETLSHLDLAEILGGPAGGLGEKAVRGRRLHETARSFMLGYLIRSPRDLYVVPQHRSAPNFITSRTVEAPVVYLDATSSCDAAIAGKIVCIESADPGFDWVFTRNISGLITKFGGANSHMAIRCAEYELPAAIGVGDMLFERVTAAPRCRLDPATHTLQVV